MAVPSFATSLRKRESAGAGTARHGLVRCLGWDDAARSCAGARAGTTSHRSAAPSRNREGERGLHVELRSPCRCCAQGAHPPANTR
uniref:Uncharacterized protein n=1 Tax=Oryza meridionalis TaxID=40149 RepID=A0A0E0EAY0_9ORYZ